LQNTETLYSEEKTSQQFLQAIMVFGSIFSLNSSTDSLAISVSEVSEDFDSTKISRQRRSPNTTAKSMPSSADGSPRKYGEQMKREISASSSASGMYYSEPFYEYMSADSDNESGMIPTTTSSSSRHSINDSSSSRDQPDNDDEFGWFDFNHETENQTSSEEIRSAWLKVVSTVSNIKVEDPTHVIYEWHNPHPSMSLKLSTTDFAKGYGVNSSSCVSGMRICQYATGEIRAEFHFVFCYGSMSYMSWKPYSEFKKLAGIITTLHRDTKSLFFQTLKAWSFLEEKKRWFRCLDIKYLIEKSILLGKFMEALLHEVPTPGLILAFIQNNRLQSLPSW
jgi:hypothetical protein